MTPADRQTGEAFNAAAVASTICSGVALRSTVTGAEQRSVAPVAVLAVAVAMKLQVELLAASGCGEAPPPAGGSKPSEPEGGLASTGALSSRLKAWLEVLLL